MKATYGRVSRAGVFPLSYSLDHIGPMTRTVIDNALMLQAIAGSDQRDPASARASVPDFSSKIEAGVRGLRVGYLRHFHEVDTPAHPEMAAALDEAVGILRKEGAEVKDVSFFPLSELAAANRIILLSEAYSIHRKWLSERPGDYAKATRDRILPGAFMGAADYVDALRRRAIYREQFKRLLTEVDVVICASSMDPACRIDDEAEVSRTYGRQARTPFNILGVPALAVPTGFSKEGLPLSMQVVGRAFDEATVYRAARAYERVTNWTTQRPNIL
jgi:aspartyl-tRNA(Asn)/glutamyl-tRNA(Gln) amidotransferase subunit A